MRRKLMAMLVLVCAAVVATSADTLVLIDGGRIEGRVVAMREDLIEFEERGTRRRIVRHRDEILRIEFTNAARVDRSNRPSDVAGGRPAGLLRRDVIVRSSEGFTNTGISVRAGQLIYIDASGRVRWGRGRDDGPAGERNSPPNPGRPIPASAAAALIGKVGAGDENIFLIGDQPGPFRMRATGPLHLGINDDVLTDNSGSFRVVVHY